MLKLDDPKSDNFKIDQKVLKSHFNSDNKFDEENLLKLTSYFHLFYDFCFELDDDSMLKGRINFKYK